MDSSNRLGMIENAFQKMHSITVVSKRRKKKIMTLYYCFSFKFLGVNCH